MNRFAVNSGTIIATDPCYDSATWCNGEFEVLNGEWESTVILQEGQVAKLTIKHESLIDPNNAHWILSEGDYGVDSGQFGFFDKQYFLDHENERDYDGPGFYSECCQLTLSKVKNGVVGGYGVVSESGWGDGTYDVYFTTNQTGHIIGLSAVFITEENDEHYLFDD